MEMTKVRRRDRNPYYQVSEKEIDYLTGRIITIDRKQWCVSGRLLRYAKVWNIADHTETREYSWDAVKRIFESQNQNLSTLIEESEE